MARNGVPVVSIGPSAWSGPDDLFEGAEIAGIAYDNPFDANTALGRILADPEDAELLSVVARTKAVELFGIETVSQQWREFLA